APPVEGGQGAAAVRLPRVLAGSQSDDLLRRCADEGGRAVGGRPGGRPCRAGGVAGRRAVGRGGVDDAVHRAHPRGGQVAAAGVGVDGFGGGGDVDAVDLVLGHITLDPLDLRPHFFEDAAGVGADGPPVVL